MKNAVGCFKWVADDADILIRPDTTIDMSRVRGKISDYDRNALHAAGEAGRVLGGQSFALTFGDGGLKPALKDALSRGVDEIYYCSDERQGTADGAGTAAVLAAAVGTLPDVAVIFCAEGASDTFARQVGPRLAALLDWPVVTSVARYEVGETGVTAWRKLEDAEEEVTVPYPAVVVILSEAADAPIPGLKAVMGAAKKPQHPMTLEELGCGTLTRKSEITQNKGYLMKRKNILLNQGQDEERAEALLRALMKEGVL